ncbi:MAG: EpsG family protein [Muribaculaceae bacterium]|nr:EpsG family protein [Muribaculaceae bacterium]
MVILAIFVGISDMLGGFDRYIYGEVFDSISASIHKGLGIYGFSFATFMWITEPAYLLWNIIIGLFTCNRYIFILITTFTIYYLFYKSFKRNVPQPLFGLILFMGLYFFFTFTYLRQVFAVAIVWNSLKFIEQRNMKKFLLTITLATLFHNSAIICFPIYFIPIRQFSRKTVIICFCICLAFGMTGIHEKIFQIFGNVVENDNRATMNYSDVKSIRPEYILESIFFLWLIFISYNRKDFTKPDIIHMNIAIIFCLILALFCRSSDGGRISWFFMIGLISLFSKMYSKPKSISVYGVALSLVSALLYIRILVVWGILLSPYKTFLTDGIRRGDYIHEFFEYDRRYNDNKFYK